MEDTTSEIKQLVYETVMARSEEERFLMCAEMFETAKEFAKIGMPEGLSKKEQDAHILRRLYGFDVDEIIRNY